MDRNVHFAVSAAAEALADSGLEITPENTEDVACVVGTAVGGIKTLLDGQQGARRARPRPRRPVRAAEPDPGHGLAARSRSRSASRGTTSRSSRPARPAATRSARPAEAIRRGDADADVAGGTEAAIVPVVLAGFTHMRALCRRQRRARARVASRSTRGAPASCMSRGRRACCCSRSSSTRAARGATIYAELVGYGSTNDAYDWPRRPTSARAPAARWCARSRRPACAPDEVDYINAHGTGTPLNDQSETAAIKSVFGDARLRPGRHLDQVDDRPHDGRGRRGRGDGLRALASSTASSRRRSTSTCPTRSATSTTRRTRRARRARARRDVELDGPRRPQLLRRLQAARGLGRR